MEAERKSMAIISSSDKMEEAYKTFIMATTGAAMDVDVTIFFTMSGLNLVKKGGADKIEMPNAPKLKELLEQAKESGVQLNPCSLSMEAMGVKPEDLIDGLSKPIGAATAIDLALKADLTLSF